MIDVKVGDKLVVDGVEYPIKSCAEWSGNFRSVSFKRQTSQAASRKRSTVIDGKRVPDGSVLSGLLVTRLDPVTSELASSAGLETPHRLKQCFLGDTTGFLHLIVEALEQ